MLATTIETVFEHGKFQVHKVVTDSGEVFHRLAVPTKVSMILHDTINDKLAVEEKRDLSTFSTTKQLPEIHIEPGQSAYTSINNFLSGMGVDVKAVDYVQTITADSRNSGKQNLLFYVQIDSRQLPPEHYVEFSGTELVRQIGSKASVGAVEIVAAYYLMRQRKRGNRNGPTA